MSRRSRKARAKGAPRFSRALVGLLVPLFGALALRCRPDLLLDDRSGPSESQTTKSQPTAVATQSRPTSPGEKPASVHLAMGTPKDGNEADDYLMIKPQYALSYNKDKNIPNWVSWNLDASYFGDAPRLKGKFLVDDTLPDGFYRVRHDDYTGSGYDRGHMVRSEERTRTAEDNKATFLLTNILPQYHDLNAGPWLRLEEYAQELSQRDKRELYLMAGGVFYKNKKTSTIGKGVAVPDAFFKIIVVLNRNQSADDVSAETRVITVLMPNKEGIMGDGWEKYRTTVDDIEKRTGYDFLSAVPESIQRVLEAREDDGN